MLTLNALAVLAGLLLLMWSANIFINGSVATARNFGMSPMLIGLTIVGFGTSAPEMLVSATAALSDASELAIGNALGSNTANVGLILGITALVSPIPIKRSVLRRELPVLLLMTIAAGALFYDLSLQRMDGILLLILLAAAMYILSREAPQTPELLEEVTGRPPIPVGKSVSLIIVGLILLIVSSKTLVWGATGIARWLQISDLIIGLTIVAIGTSLPELAASITSALKGHHDIALGNVIGSNLFNLLGVVAIPALIAPMELESIVFSRDYMIMSLFTIALAAFVYIMHRKGRLSRWEGGLFLVGYALYSYILFLDVSSATSSLQP